MGDEGLKNIVGVVKFDIESAREAARELHAENANNPNIPDSTSQVTSAGKASGTKSAMPNMREVMARGQSGNPTAGPAMPMIKEDQPTPGPETFGGSPTAGNVRQKRGIASILGALVGGRQRRSQPIPIQPTFNQGGGPSASTFTGPAPVSPTAAQMGGQGSTSTPPGPTLRPPTPPTPIPPPPPPPPSPNPTGKGFRPFGGMSAKIAAMHAQLMTPAAAGAFMRSYGTEASLGAKLEEGESSIRTAEARTRLAEAKTATAREVKQQYQTQGESKLAYFRASHTPEVFQQEMSMARLNYAGKHQAKVDTKMVLAARLKDRGGTQMEMLKARGEHAKLVSGIWNRQRSQQLMSKVASGNLMALPEALGSMAMDGLGVMAGEGMAGAAIGGLAATGVGLGVAAVGAAATLGGAYLSPWIGDLLSATKSRGRMAFAGYTGYAQGLAAFAGAQEKNENLVQLQNSAGVAIIAPLSRPGLTKRTFSTEAAGYALPSLLRHEVFNLNLRKKALAELQSTGYYQANRLGVQKTYNLTPANVALFKSKIVAAEAQLATGVSKSGRLESFLLSNHIDLAHKWGREMAEVELGRQLGVADASGQIFGVPGHIAPKNFMGGFQKFSSAQQKILMENQLGMGPMVGAILHSRYATYNAQQAGLTYADTHPISSKDNDEFVRKVALEYRLKHLSIVKKMKLQDEQWLHDEMRSAINVIHDIKSTENTIKSFAPFDWYTGF